MTRNVAGSSKRDTYTLLQDKRRSGGCQWSKNTHLLLSDVVDAILPHDDDDSQSPVTPPREVPVIRVLYSDILTKKSNLPSNVLLGDFFSRFKYTTMVGEVSITLQDDRRWSSLFPCG